MRSSLHEMREKVHRKSQEYLAFDYGRRDRAKWRMFYGATDALLDAGTAAAHYSEAIGPHPGVNLLICYGYLQALYVQQDAVRTLSRAVDLSWHPNSNDNLKKIRDIRNRLTGHPARADQLDPPSSAIIAHGSIGKGGFLGHVYFEGGHEEVRVDVKRFLEENEEGLVTQMIIIDQKMDADEASFRATRSSPPLSSCFDRKFQYLHQRLHCDLSDEGRVGQARAHSDMMRDVLIETKAELARRDLSSEMLSDQLETLLRGLDRLNQIMESGQASVDSQRDFNLIYDGITANLESLKTRTREIDSLLSASVP